MGLAESLKKVGTVQSICTLGKIIDKLDESEREALEGALDSPMAVHTIESALRSNGHRIASLTITNHRKKTCPCYWGDK